MRNYSQCHKNTKKKIIRKYYEQVYANKLDRRNG